MVKLEVQPLAGCVAPHGPAGLSHVILQFPPKSQTPNCRGLRQPAGAQMEG